MGTGRPQKGMTRKNHHDSLSQSGQQRRTSGGGRAPRYTVSDAIMGKKPPKPMGSSASSIFGNSAGKSSGGRKPCKSF